MPARSRPYSKRTAGSGGSTINRRRAAAVSGKAKMVHGRLASDYNKRYDQGYDAGFDSGYAAGWNRGVETASSTFPGTSIIIPTYNQWALLEKCLESIEAHTPEPHEIIVVDNGSTDGTQEGIRSWSDRVVYKRLEMNLGFAPGINQGLRLARGESLLLLNNDTVVTERWLSNLLQCLHAYPKAGLVGPVTNYISGSQQIETAYNGMEEMQRFASSYNRSDPGQWQETDRLTGFCVLMKRDLFRKLGYMDEGFKIGNCEDDDYGLRTRLLGHKLVIARDTFIHHVGSASMKQLEQRFDEVYGGNLLFFGRKWGEPGRLIPYMEAAQQQMPISMDFSLSHVIVKGKGDTRYWVENGVRYPIAEGEGLDAVRLSMVDLKSMLLGHPIHRSEAERKQADLLWMPQTGGGLMDGSILQDEQGALYQYAGGAVRPFIGETVRSGWKVENRPVCPVADDIVRLFPSGLPVMAPPVILRSDQI